MDIYICPKLAQRHEYGKTNNDYNLRPLEYIVDQSNANVSD